MQHDTYHPALTGNAYDLSILPPEPPEPPAGEIDWYSVAQQLRLAVTDLVRQARDVVEFCEADDDRIGHGHALTRAHALEQVLTMFDDAGIEASEVRADSDDDIPF